MEMTARQRPNYVWLVLALVALAVAFLSVAPPSRHAANVHGPAAQRVTMRLCAADPCEPDTWSEVCLAGRRYTFHDNRNGSYDVSVDAPDLSFNVTRFVTRNSDWVARKLAWCGWED